MIWAIKNKILLEMSFKNTATIDWQQVWLAQV